MLDKPYNLKTFHQEKIYKSWATNVSIILKLELIFLIQILGMGLSLKEFA
jgi:hypothetical protein